MHCYHPPRLRRSVVYYATFCATSVLRQKLMLFPLLKTMLHARLTVFHWSGALPAGFQIHSYFGMLLALSRSLFNVSKSMILLWSRGPTLACLLDASLLRCTVCWL